MEIASEHNMWNGVYPDAHGVTSAVQRSLQRKNTDFWCCKKACQDVIYGNYLKRDNFITLFDVHLHITSNSIQVTDFNSVFICREIFKKSDSHFGSFLLFHTERGTVYYDLVEISVKYIYNITVQDLYLWKGAYEH